MDCSKMSKTTPFLEPRMVGTRFENHSIPLELLKDLAALENILIDVAKWHYFKDNPERQRCPNGFTNGVSLRLEGIDEGSAIPKIVLISALTLMPVGSEHYFQKAKDSIISVINAAQQNQLNNHEIPKHLLYSFDRIGRSLRDDEAIEFNPGTSSPARLDKVTRHRLVMASSKAHEYTESVVLRGSIYGVNLEHNRFDMKLIDGRQVSGMMQPQFQDDVLKALNGYNQNKGKVKIEGIGVYNRFGQLKTLATVEHLSLLPPRDVGARLDEFRTLKEGWFDGAGNRFEPKQLDWLTDNFERLYGEDLPLPWIYPMPTGTLRCEWRSSDYEASLEIDLSTQNGEWLSFVKHEPHETEQTLDLSQEQAWQWINQELGGKLI